MPGMWDCHGHFLGIAELSFEYDAKTHSAVKAARATADAADALMAGVTSVREPGGLGMYLKPAIEENRSPGQTSIPQEDAVHHGRSWRRPRISTRMDAGRPWLWRGRDL